MKKDQKVLRYEEAASVLPVRLRKLALALPEDQKGAAEEFRLRTGQPLMVLLPSGEVPLMHRPASVSASRKSLLNS